MIFGGHRLHDKTLELIAFKVDKKKVIRWDYNKGFDFVFEDTEISKSY